MFRLLLVALLGQSHIQEVATNDMDQLIDKLVDQLDARLFGRALNTASPHDTDFDGTALGKPGKLALSHTGGSPLQATQPRTGSLHSMPRVSPSSMASFQPREHGSRKCMDTYIAANNGKAIYNGKCALNSKPGSKFPVRNVAAHVATQKTSADTSKWANWEKIASEMPEALSDAPVYQRMIYKGVKQVVTLGPASFAKDMITTLFEAGADVFRINFSHGREELGEITQRIRSVEAEKNYPIGILADLQGPKQRCGMFKDGAKIDLKEGQKFRFDMDPEEGDDKRVQLPHPEILEALKPGKTLLIDDGKIRMKVEATGDKWIECVVTVPGTISSRKGVNTPDVVLPITPITEKDETDLKFIMDYRPDFVALSFVQQAQDVLDLRKMIKEHPCPHKPKIVAKIEKPVAVENLEAIVEASDAIMVARGDLGVEMEMEDVPMIQKQIVAESRKQGKPVIMATQMLETMMSCPTPTRAECSDVATAVFDGVDAVMLSGESAAGQFPEESVEMQRKIVIRTEKDPVFNQYERLYSLPPAGSTTQADSVVTAAKNLAETLEAKCLVIFTTTGSTASRVSRLHTKIPILAITPSKETVRGLTLNNHVYPAMLTAPWEGKPLRFSVLVDEAVRIARAKGFVTKDSDKLVITGGLPVGIKGLANIIRIVQAAGGDCWNEEVCEVDGTGEEPFVLR